MSLNDYLTKYLTKDEAPDKKAKKRRRKEEKGRLNAAGSMLVDDDALGWEKSKEDDEDDDDSPLVVNDRSSAQFRKSKTSKWSTVVSNEAALADSILASNARENASAANALADDEAPVIVDSKNNNTVHVMESGAAAGLQTAAQVTAAMNKKRNAELAAFKSTDAVTAGKGAETIYRDASGRIVNIALQRAEARKKQEAEEQKLAEQKNANRGDVQLANEAKYRARVENARYQPFARGVDDAEMNEELKEKDRWNDPAAAFLTKRTEGKSVSGLPLYKGAAPPNRYGILPGHRWDGVDRGNGTEGLFFRKKNERKDRQQMEYDWQMDV